MEHFIFDGKHFASAACSKAQFLSLLKKEELALETVPVDHFLDFFAFATNHLYSKHFFHIIHDVDETYDLVARYRFPAHYFNQAKIARIREQILSPQLTSNQQVWEFTFAALLNLSSPSELYEDLYICSLVIDKDYRDFSFTGKLLATKIAAASLSMP
jgi:hypothetical protein